MKLEKMHSPCLKLHVIIFLLGIFFFYTNRPSRPSLMLNDIHLNIPVPLTLPFLGTALYAQMPAASHVPQFEIIIKDEATHYFLA